MRGWRVKDLCKFAACYPGILIFYAREGKTTRPGYSWHLATAFVDSSSRWSRYRKSDTTTWKNKRRDSLLKDVFFISSLFFFSSSFYFFCISRGIWNKLHCLARQNKILLTSSLYLRRSRAYQVTPTLFLHLRGRHAVAAVSRQVPQMAPSQSFMKKKNLCHEYAKEGTVH